MVVSTTILDPMGDALFDDDQPLLPADWDLPSAIRARLGHTVGRQRVIAEAGHLLVILHRVPAAEEHERRACIAWRDPSGRWRTTSGVEGLLGLRQTIDEYRTTLVALDERIESAPAIDGYFEILEQLGTEPDLVIVPVGGGGCVSGITTYLAERTTTTSVLGVEPAGAAALVAALANGAPVTLDDVDQFVDGAAVARVGKLPFAALSAAGDMVSITTVDEGAVCTAMLDLYQNEGIIAAPAGALSVAALLDADIEPESTVVCLISGGNNDVSRYGEVLERSLVHLGLKHYFLVDFPQEPGALRRFLDEVLGPNDDITLFEYVKRNNRETGEALVGIEMGSASDLEGLLARMRTSECHAELLEPGSPTYRYLT